MCRLSCSVCDKMEEQPHDPSRRRERFRNIGQLKGHLFHRHKLHMCSLCLEGRKVKFILLAIYMNLLDDRICYLCFLRLMLRILTLFLWCRYLYVSKSYILEHSWINTYAQVTLKWMEVRVREVVLWGILCVNSAEPHFMGTMNCTRICLQNIIHVIYAKGNN